MLDDKLLKEIADEMMARTEGSIKSHDLANAVLPDGAWAGIMKLMYISSAPVLATGGMQRLIGVIAGCMVIGFDMGRRYSEEEAKRGIN